MRGIRLTLLCSMFIAICFAASWASEIVDIPDPNLEAAIRDALGIPLPTPLTDDDLATLTELDASEREISNLTGLEYCVNLEELYLYINQISDVSPLAGLLNLEWLDLDSNEISDISPLAGLINLEWLWLSTNQISDTPPGISPLAGLINLWLLDLRDNEISNVSPLAGLISLQRLHLYNNQISDVSPLAGLINLWLLDLRNNEISNVSPLAGLINLEYLYLSSNQISDVSPLAGLLNLYRLYLQDNQISDLQPLVSNTGLAAGDYVDVRQNPLSYKSINTYIPILQSRGVYVDFDDRIPTILTKVSGDGQTGRPGSTLPEPLVVEVDDQNGVSFEGVPVTFTVTAGGGYLSDIDDATDADGLASAILTLGPEPGTNTVEVAAADIAETVIFNAIAESVCAIAVVSSDTALHEELHQFRDNLLAGNEVGQMLIYFYYHHSPEVSDILLNNPMLSVRSAAILNDVMPGIRFLLGNRMGRDIVMTRPLVGRIQRLFADIGEEGSDDLAATLAQLSEMLDDLKGRRISEIWQSLE